ncbi:caspase family protein [Pseudorhodoplanes sp.]|uniref:caspase family protein n=1 Tax=Pseudorhodoplanes sp. TaxID=1934341 RepID=UPI003918E1C5
MIRLAAFLSALLFGAFLSAEPATAQKRVALVIGNGGYKHSAHLKNPANDANDVAAALQRLGFDVLRGIDLSHDGMRDILRSFSQKVEGSDVALLFYAGHGLQVGGKNYLLPVDARIETQADLEFGSIDLNRVMSFMEGQAKTSIVFLDACRDNPLGAALSRGTRSAAVGRGLAQIESGIGSLIAFATQPGNVALDGEGRNSPFTSALLTVIEQPGLPLSEVMISVRNEVLKTTGGKQVPWEHSSLTGQFYFKPVKPGSITAPDQAGLEVAFWNSIQHSKNPQLFEAYLRRYPNGTFAEIAKINLQEVRQAAALPIAPDEKTPLSEAGLLREINERLYELNFDTDVDASGERMRAAIRQFESRINLAQTGIPTRGILNRLRDLGGLKPWGAIVYSKADGRWGMSWDHQTRRAAVDDARKTCGADSCAIEVSFFGTSCGAFASSDASWALSTRDDLQRAKDAALGDCGKRGKPCRIIAASCADGDGRMAAR